MSHRWFLDGKPHSPRRCLPPMARSTKARRPAKPADPKAKPAKAAKAPRPPRVPRAPKTPRPAKPARAAKARRWFGRPTAPAQPAEPRPEQHRHNLNPVLAGPPPPADPAVLLRWRQARPSGGVTAYSRALAAALARAGTDVRESHPFHAEARLGRLRIGGRASLAIGT